MELWLTVLLLLLASSDVRLQELPNIGNSSDESLCHLVEDNGTNNELFIPNEIGPVVMFYNEFEPESVDMACLLKRIAPHARHVPFRFPDPRMVCLQLILHPSKPGELHVLFTYRRGIGPFCETQVYGSLPTLIEVGRTKLAGRPHGDFFTFYMTGNGGIMDFDVENNKDNVTAKNMMLAFKVLISVYISGRPWQNGFSTFHRYRHVMSNPHLASSKRWYRETVFGSSMRLLLHLRNIPVLIYAFIVAFLLVVPFTRRKIHVDNVMLDNFDGTGRDEETPSNLGVLPNKRTSSKSPSENTHPAAEHTAHQQVSSHGNEEHTATDTEPGQSFPDAESYLLPIKEEETQASRRGNWTHETKESHDRKEEMGDHKHMKTHEAKRNSGST